jgi:citrate lyase subunit gamma (acyl carrier protein)
MVKMEITGVGIAGTLESSDITVQIEKNEGKGIAIELKSTVEKQFGNQIRSVIRETLQEMKITEALVRATDKGALDCTVRARVKAAANRASHNSSYAWEVK